jgi:hypothetical protein
VLGVLVTMWLLGVAVWRSGILPKWAGALWAFAPMLIYIVGLAYALTIGAQATHGARWRGTAGDKRGVDSLEWLDGVGQAS